MIKSLDELTHKAKNLGSKRLVVAAAEDIAVLRAVVKAKELGLITPVFIGNAEKIKDYLSILNFKIDPDSIWHEPDNDKAAHEAVLAVSNGNADLLMKGLIPTKNLLKQVVKKEFKLVKNGLLSHLAIFESPFYHKLFGVTDAAMNIAPGLDEKVKIIENSLPVLYSLGLDKPLIAVLAAVEKVNEKMRATTDADLLKKMNQNGLITKCIVDGPLAMDNAISNESAKHKSIESSVAGNADLLLVPNIESGNILYKTLTYLGNARCASLITGSEAPIILTSRADSEETKFFSIILGLIACNKN